MRLRWLVAGLLGLGMLGLLPGVALAEGCPNELARTGPSANLPDCRAYEQVSPVDKNNGSVSEFFLQYADLLGSVDGNRMIFSSSQAFADAQTGADINQPYLATRGADGWSTHALLPPQAVNSGNVLPRFLVFTGDLTRSVLEIGGDFPGQDDPPLVNGEPPENQNLFMRDSSGAYHLVDVTPAGVQPAEASYRRASTDLSHVVFSENAQLTANAPEGLNVYDWSNGVVSLVNVLPGGAPLVSREVNMVSDDGSRIVFEAIAQGSGLGLFLRENDARTVQIDASQGPGAGGGGEFQVASADGSKIFFTDSAEQGLTNDTVPGSGVNLYEYEVAGGRLTDLTPSSQAEVFDVQTAMAHGDGSGILGAASDGAYIYFIAAGALASGATAGQPNLYVWHEGAMSFIASAEGMVTRANHVAEFGVGSIPATLTLDGSEVAFESSAGLTGYDNRDASSGQPDIEVFLYDAPSRRLTCVSCNPSGVRPIGSSLITTQRSEESYAPPAYQHRYLSSDGSRVFFNSFDAIIPQDTNGKEDVYEYEQGHVYLISTGTASADSQFADASADGSDVFFATAQQLVGQDRDQQFDIYDARVDGGFPQPPTPAPCDGEGCRAAPAATSVQGAPSSMVFSGMGNLAPVAQAPAVKPKAKAKKKRAKKTHRRAKRVARKVRRGGTSHSTGKRG